MTTDSAKNGTDVLCGLIADVASGRAYVVDHSRRRENTSDLTEISIRTLDVDVLRGSASSLRESAAAAFERLAMAMTDRLPPQERFELAERLSTLWMQQTLAAESELGRAGRAPAPVDGPTSRDIEGMLVAAFKLELENYEDSHESWRVVHAAIDGLRRRDEEIERLRAELAKMST